MATRSRPRKPRLTRMDAAIDAMRPLGFPGEQVRKRVKGLLKEYGGDDGWPFIEADAYKLLIDTILDEQEDGAVGEETNEKENLLLNEELGDERPGYCSAAADPGPSTPALPPISSMVAGAAAQTMETGKDQLLIAERDREGGDGSRKGMQFDSFAKGSDGSVERMQIDNPLFQSSLPLIPSPPPVNALPRRHKPCYGWISSGDEEDEFIQLTPAPRLKPSKPPGQPENRVSGTDKRQKRKSMWDVKP